MRYWLGGLCLVLSGWIQGVAAEVTVEQGYVRAMPPGAPNTAAFMRLVNAGSEPVVIDGGAADVAGRVEIHAHSHSHGMMSMHQVASITVPAGGEFVLEPGGHHLMLMNLVTPLKEGDTVLLQLLSGEAVAVRAELPVRSVLKEHRH